MEAGLMDCQESEEDVTWEGRGREAFLSLQEMREKGEQVDLVVS